MTEKEKQKMEEIVSLAKQRGFIFQGSEIYDGLAGTWDYGPLGVELKRAIKNLWWEMFVQERDDIYGLDASILMNRGVWEASGHAEGFVDPMVEDLENKKRYRADHLLEKFGIEAEDLSVEEMNEVIKEKEIKSPDGNDLGEVKTFNMMFETKVGSVDSSSSSTFLRPETAQGIFANFKNVLDSLHPKIPFGIAQIGKAFRNEITPRDFIFRVREFEQMEIEYFVKEKDWEKHFEEFKKAIWEWVDLIGLSRDGVSENEVSNPAHYSKRTIDFEYEYPFGKSELYGLAYRTDYDLKKHMEKSGKDLQYFEQETGERFIPHVIEPSLGVDRTVLAILCDNYKKEEVEGEERVLFTFTPQIAPVQVAVLPLLRKDGHPELAQEVAEKLKSDWRVEYNQTSSIGKRYRRFDEIGTPFCITIDHQSLEDQTVTVRHRDTMEQDRVSIEELDDYLKNYFKKS